MAVVAPLRKGVKLLFVGMLMGICDLVPGVSGSSIAYLCGLYEPLVEAVSAPRRNFLFLAPLAAGILLVLVSFAIPLNLAMQSSVARVLLLSFFIGISLACACRALSEAKGEFAFLLVGFVSSFLLNMLTSEHLISASYPWIFIAGITCGLAMLFPAISGAQMLYLLGLYPFIIENLAHFVASGSASSFSILFTLGSGVLCGLFITSKLMRLLFHRFSSKIHGFFAGFILVALTRLWPFESIFPSGSGLISLAFGLAAGLGLNVLTKRRGHL